MKSRKITSYDVDRMASFLNTIYHTLECGFELKGNYSTICKRYKIGNSKSKAALQQCGLVKIDGRGMKNWKWIHNGAPNSGIAYGFINCCHRLNREHNEKYKDQAPTPADQHENHRKQQLKLDGGELRYPASLIVINKKLDLIMAALNIEK